MILLEKNDGLVSRWSGGITTQLMISPKGSLYQSRSFDFRISVAEIEEEHSVFTPLPDYHRTLVSLSPHITLQNGGEQVRLNQYDCYTFDGGDSVESFGQASDFGVMCRKGVCSAKVEVITLEKDSVYKNSGAYVYVAQGYGMETEGGVRILSDKAVLIAVQISYELKLVLPSENHGDIWRTAMSKLGPLPRGEQFATYEDYLAEVTRQRQRTEVEYDARYQQEMVPATTYFMTDSRESAIIGVVNIRWKLNEALRHFGGNIGYNIIPGFEGKGYGTKLLALALEQCRAAGLFAVMLTCDADNRASSAVMLHNGAQRYSTDITADGTAFERYFIIL